MYKSRREEPLQKGFDAWRKAVVGRVALQRRKDAVACGRPPRPLQRSVRLRAWGAQCTRVAPASPAKETRAKAAVARAARVLP
jgi:hypothetical protein